MLRRLLFVLLLFPGLLAGSGEAWARKTDKLTPQDRYELGMKYLKRGYYTKALEQFNRVRNYSRDDPYAVKAELAIADLHYKKAEWDQARLAYEDFLRLHPRHEELDYVVFRVGMCLWKKAPSAAGRDQTWTRQAVDTWSTFETRFPTSDEAGDVQKRLQAGRNRLARKELLIARFYLQRKAWRASIGRLEGLLRDYPSYEEKDRALAMLVTCRVREGDVAGARAAMEQLQGLEGARERYIRSARRVLPEG